MKMLPEGILEASFRRNENGGFALCKTHPYYEEAKKEVKKAYVIMNKLSWAERNMLDSCRGLEIGIHFDIGYAAGLVDGIATGGAVGGAITPKRSDGE